MAKDLERYGSEKIDVEQRLAFVYPLANFIYLAPQPRLRARMEYGIERAKETGQLETLASEYLEKDLLKNQFFKIRMIILQNPNLTEKAREAINQYGFITFEKSTQPIR